MPSALTFSLFGKPFTNKEHSPTVTISSYITIIINAAPLLSPWHEWKSCAANNKLNNALAAAAHDATHYIIALSCGLQFCDYQSALCGDTYKFPWSNGLSNRVPMGTKNSFLILIRFLLLLLRLRVNAVFMIADLLKRIQTCLSLMNCNECVLWFIWLCESVIVTVIIIVIIKSE